jgi:hypothetical protein
MSWSCALTCCAAWSSAGCSASLVVNGAWYWGGWGNWADRGCWGCWNCSNECTLVVDARERGRLLLVDIDVFDRDRRMSVIARRRTAKFPSVYTKTMRWQRTGEAATRSREGLDWRMKCSMILGVQWVNNRASWACSLSPRYVPVLLVCLFGPGTPPTRCSVKHNVANVAMML